MKLTITFLTFLLVCLVFSLVSCFNNMGGFMGGGYNVNECNNFIACNNGATCQQQGMGVNQINNIGQQVGVNNQFNTGMQNQQFVNQQEQECVINVCNRPVCVNRQNACQRMCGAGTRCSVVVTPGMGWGNNQVVNQVGGTVSIQCQ